MPEEVPTGAYDLGGGPPRDVVSDVEPSDHEVVANQLIIQALSVHPMPWSIEGDWGYTVMDREGHKVCSCASQAEAQLVVTAAETMERYFRECEAQETQFDLGEEFVIPPGNDI